MSIMIKVGLPIQQNTTHIQLIVGGFGLILKPPINPSYPGLPELHETLKEGNSALPLKIFQIWLKTHFFKVSHSFYYIKIIIVKVGCVKGKLFKKKVTAEKL